MSKKQLHECGGQTIALADIAAEALEVSGTLETSSRFTARLASTVADLSAQPRLRQNLHVEVVVRTDDVRITGSWSFQRGCSAASFIGGMVLLLAMARHAARASSGASSLMRMAFGITVSAQEATYRLTGLFGGGAGTAGNRA